MKVMIIVKVDRSGRNELLLAYSNTVMYHNTGRIHVSFKKKGQTYYPLEYLKPADNLYCRYVDIYYQGKT